MAAATTLAVATDAAGERSADVRVNVGPFPGNRAPLLALTATALNVPTTAPVTFAATATDPDGDPLTAVLVATTTHGSLTLTDPQGSSIELGQTGSPLHASLHIYDWRAAGLILRQALSSLRQRLR